MVHRDARHDPVLRASHQAFMFSRIICVLAAFCLLPPYALWKGSLDALELTALAAVAMPLLGVAVLSRTGKLEQAQMVSAAALTLLVLVLAAASGGMFSPALLWLVAVPLEAIISGQKRLMARVAGIASLGLVLLAGVEFSGHLAMITDWSAAAVPVLVVAVILHALMIGVSLSSVRASEHTAQLVAHERARLMLNSVSDLVTWHDASGAVIHANHSARSVLSVEPDSIRDRGLFALVHITDRPAYLKLLSDVAHGGQPGEAIVRALVLREGQDAPEVVWLEMRASRAGRGSDLANSTVVCVSRDITQKRETETIRDQQAEREARINSARSQFLATVSHELRTPLNAIIGFSEMLATESFIPMDAGKREEYARIIHGSGQHLLEVVNTLLDVSKIESGAMTIDPEPVDLPTLVGSCCDLLDIRAKAGDVRLERVLGPELPTLSCDRRALKQVVINLLSNAIKFTPAEGSVTIAVVRDGHMIDLSVTDTGIGIAEADLPRLGDPFFQAKSSYDRTYEGTGLGLSVVRGLVGLHGGTLTIESAPGAGTRVGVRLPLELRDEASAPVRIATYIRQPRRGLEDYAPVRLTG